MGAAEDALVQQGISIDELMQRAGQGAAQQIRRLSGAMPTLVLCGPGNNGGDGYVLAQWLLEKGVPISVAEMTSSKTEAAQNAKSLWTGETVPLADAEARPQIVDCLFGTGLQRPLEAKLLKRYTALGEEAKRRVAIDVPSGVETDSGKLLNDIPRFDATISLGAFKPAHYLEPATSMMGKRIGVDIGIDASSDLHVIRKPLLEKPASRDHKYSRGLAVVIAGEMPGAASLAAMAAQNAGAGYVKIFAPEGYQPPRPSIVVEKYREADELSDLLSDQRISSVVIGPGLGCSAYAGSLIQSVIKSGCPIILDADALTLLGADFTDVVASRKSSTVATPHEGEFKRISESDAQSKIERARELAQNSSATIIYKGSDTVIAEPDGSAAIAGFSAGWLSTAGTGDVLAGILAGRLASDSDTFSAAQQSQWLHSRSAQLAGPAFSPERLIAHIPQSIEECL